MLKMARANNVFEQQIKKILLNRPSYVGLTYNLAGLYYGIAASYVLHLYPLSIQNFSTTEEIFVLTIYIHHHAACIT